jgi:hypothetical protein
LVELLGSFAKTSPACQIVAFVIKHLNSSIYFVSIQIAPFLTYWDDFEKAGFDVFSSLKEIAVELEHHHDENITGLSSGNLMYLLRRATEIYFIKMTNYFFFSTDESSLFSHYYGQKKGFAELQEIQRKTNEYRLFILGLLKRWYSDDLKAVDDLIEMYQN